MVFQIGGKIVQCPWRVVRDDTLRLSSADHQQLFGFRTEVRAQTPGSLR